MDAEGQLPLTERNMPKDEIQAERNSSQVSSLLKQTAFEDRVDTVLMKQLDSSTRRLERGSPNSTVSALHIRKSGGPGNATKFELQNLNNVTPFKEQVKHKNLSQSRQRKSSGQRAFDLNQKSTLRAEVLSQTDKMARGRNMGHNTKSNNQDLIVVSTGNFGNTEPPSQEPSIKNVDQGAAERPYLVRNVQYHRSGNSVEVQDHVQTTTLVQSREEHPEFKSTSMPLDIKLEITNTSLHKEESKDMVTSFASETVLKPTFSRSITKDKVLIHQHSPPLSPRIEVDSEEKESERLTGVKKERSQEIPIGQILDRDDSLKSIPAIDSEANFKQPSQKQFVVQRSKKPVESERIFKNESKVNIKTLKEFKDSVLDPTSVEKSQLTSSYIVQVQEVDRHAMGDPALIDHSQDGILNTQFKQTHPSLYLPKHQYRRYKMKDGRNKTGLNVIKEKPISNKQFAIMHLMHRDVQKSLRDSLDEADVSQERESKQQASRATRTERTSQERGNGSTHKFIVDTNSVDQSRQEARKKSDGSVLSFAQMQQTRFIEKPYTDSEQPFIKAHKALAQSYQVLQSPKEGVSTLRTMSMEQQFNEKYVQENDYEMLPDYRTDKHSTKYRLINQDSEEDPLKQHFAKVNSTFKSIKQSSERKSEGDFRAELKQSLPAYSKPISRDSYNRVGLKIKGESASHERPSLGPNDTAQKDSQDYEAAGAKLANNMVEVAELMKTSQAPNWLSLLDSEPETARRGMPKFLQSKESLHNFQNKLLYMDGYKSLKMDQMYEALRDETRKQTPAKPSESKISITRKSTTEALRSEKPSRFGQTSTLDILKNARRSSQNEAIADKTITDQALSTFLTETSCLPNLIDQKPRVNQSQRTLPTIKSTLSKRVLQPHLAAIYDREQSNYSSNQVVNQKPKDRTWDMLRQVQKAVVQAKARNDQFNRLSCDVQPNEWLYKKQFASALAKKNQRVMNVSESQQKKSSPSDSKQALRFKVKAANGRSTGLVEASHEREQYVPLTHLDKVKLANHIDQLVESFVQQVPTQVQNWQFLLPSQFDKHERNQEKDVLLTIQEKQKVVAQFELYRKVLLKGNKLRQAGRHNTVSIKDLRQDPINKSAYFKLVEQHNDIKKVFRELDPAIKIAINFISQSEVIKQPTISGYKNMLIKMLEMQTAQARQTVIESGASGVLPLKVADQDESVAVEENEMYKTTSMNDTQNVQNETQESLFASLENAENLEEIYEKAQKDEKKRESQLQTMTNIKLSKKLDNNFYNEVIDECNVADQEVAQFFESVAGNDLDKIKRAMLINPLIAYEVNDKMETALHVAVSFGHFDIAEYLLESDCARVLLQAVDMRRRSALDVAKKNKQHVIIELIQSHLSSKVL